MANELEKVAGKYGVSGGGPQYLPDDPRVYMGRKETNFFGRGAKRYGKVPTEETYSTQSEAEKDFYAMSPAELRSFQEKAFAAGLYGNSDREDIAFGDYDEQTFAIWKSMVNRSAGFLARGVKKSPNEALDDAVKNAPAGAGKGKKRDPLSGQVSNPADIRKTVNDTALEVLGRKLSPKQLDEYVTLYQAQQRKAQEAAYANQEAGGFSTEMPSASAFAEEQLRSQHPDEAHAHGVISRADEFYSLLKSPV